jgi:hypothetical protein
LEKTSFSRSHAEQRNACPDAPRRLQDAERPDRHSHAERGNEEKFGSRSHAEQRNACPDAPRRLQDAERPDSPRRLQDAERPDSPRRLQDAQRPDSPRRLQDAQRPDRHSHAERGNEEKPLFTLPPVEFLALLNLLYFFSKRACNFFESI